MKKIIYKYTKKIILALQAQGYFFDGFEDYIELIIKKVIDESDFFKANLMTENYRLRRHNEQLIKKINDSESRKQH